jgi:uncharacterized protein (DUF1810 family)
MKSQSQNEFEHFIQAQSSVYDSVVVELERGEKRSHWMWFIFPQLAGLGFSEMSRRYALHSLDQAARYANDPVLGMRLRECTRLILNTQRRNIRQILGVPDDLKFHSSMTLFSLAVPEEVCFQAALKQYFNGIKDKNTLVLSRQD